MFGTLPPYMSLLNILSSVYYPWILDGITGHVSVYCVLVSYFHALWE